MAKAKKSKSEYANVENKDRYQAMMGLRSSNAAVPHVMKKHKGTRSNSKSRAIRDFY